MPVKLVDSQFRYTPAEATNVVETWRRFGFDTSVNVARRERSVSARISPLPRVVRPRLASNSR